MKKYILTIAFLFFGMSIFAQTPRYCDIRVNFTKPELGHLVQSPTYLSYQFKVTNQGPDTLYEDDSLLFRPTHTFNQTTLDMRVLGIGKIIIPGDSFFVDDTIFINGDIDMDQMKLFFSYTPACISRNPSRRLDSEFIEDQKDNADRLFLVHRAAKAGVLSKLTDRIKVFPNPVSSADLNLDWPEYGNFSVSISDVNGRQHFSVAMPLIAGTNKIPLNGLGSGLYFLTIQNEDTQWNAKIIISND